jgi:hypothetical protein
MPETTTAPATGATVAAPAAPALPALPSTADLLAEVAAGTAPKAGAAAGRAVVPVTGSSAASAETGSPADGAPKPEGGEQPKPEGGETSRLAALAREQRRIDAGKREIENARRALETEKATFEAERKATGEGAAKWKAFNEAKTGKGRIAALEVLFDGGEITDQLYGELTDYVLKNNKAPTSDETIAKKVSDEVKKQKEAEDEARRKDAEVRAAEDAKKTTASEAAYVDGVFAKFDVAKYPTIARFADSGVEGLAVSGQDILAYVKAEFGAGRRVPSHEEALAHFETVIKTKAEKLGLAGERKPSVPNMVSASSSNDAPPVNVKDGPGIDEIHKQALREAGLA